MPNQIHSFTGGFPVPAAQISTPIPMLRFPVDRAPFGQTLSCLFRTVLTLLHLRFVLWDSEDAGQGQPCWGTAESFLMLKSQEPGERRCRCVVQLIHLALRLAWPTNYLSKGHSPAPHGFRSFRHSEGKMSPKKPCKQPAWCWPLNACERALLAAYYQTFAFIDQSWARECPKNQVGSGKHKSCSRLVSRLLPSYSDPSLSLSLVCNTYRMECNT